jgi:hypothetical protein
MRQLSRTSRSTSPPPRLSREDASYNLIRQSPRSPPRLSREYSDNLYIINYNENNNVLDHASDFLMNLQLNTYYSINNTHISPNEVTYGFRMFNNVPARIIMNVNTGALRIDTSFFRRL